MIAEATIEVNKGHCLVGGALDFTTSRSALERLRPIIEEQKSLEIDLRAVTTANSAGLALLIECQAIARAQDHQVGFSNIPDGLKQLAHVCEVNGLI